jgi:hypothetical protein
MTPWEVAGRPMNLTSELQAIVVGSLLGDAYPVPNGTLQIEHCLEHAEYAVWKYERLTGIVGKPPKLVERLDRRSLDLSLAAFLYQGRPEAVSTAVPPRRQEDRSR